jgi:hypothetical protein
VPVIIALRPNAAVLYQAAGTPAASAAIWLSRIATMARPMRPCRRFAASPKQISSTTSVSRYIHWSKLIGRPKGTAGLSRAIPWPPPVHCSIDLCFTTMGSTAPSANVAIARCIAPSRNVGRPNAIPATRLTAAAAGMASRCGSPAVRGQYGGGVRAYRVERAVPQRDLAVVADQDIQAEQGDGVDEDAGKL